MIEFSCHLLHYLLDQVMCIQMAVKAVGHLLMHCGCMRFAVAIPALRNTRMLGAVTEGTGKCLMLGHGFFHKGTFLLMTGNAEAARCRQRRSNLQWMMGRVAAQAVTDHLALDMRLVTRGAFGDLAVDLVAERTILLGMHAWVIGKVLTRTIMAGQTGVLDIGSKMQGQGLMGIGVAAETVLKFEMIPILMTLRALRDNVFPPGRMFFMAVEAGDLCLMLTTVAGNGCRFILVALDAIRHLENNPLRFGGLCKNH